MAQRVTVTSDSPIELKPLIESAIRSELRILALGLDRTKQRLQAFEDRFDLTSDEFERRFETGEIEESLDFIEWAGEIKTFQHLDAQRKVLQKVRLN